MSWIALFYLLLVSCHSPGTHSTDIEVARVTADTIRDPYDISKPPVIKQGPRVMVEINAADKIFIDKKELPVAVIDSLLKIEIEKKKLAPMDTVTVILSVDTATSYGTVFQVMRAAKKVAGTKVVANVH